MEMSDELFSIIGPNLGVQTPCSLKFSCSTLLVTRAMFYENNRPIISPFWLF